MKNRKIKLGLLAAILSIITLFFHAAFFRHAANQVDPGTNGKIILVCLGLLMLVIDFLAYYIVLYLGRFIGKIILAITFIIDAGCLYFINTYDVYLDKTMMGNVFNTNSQEATGYYSSTFILYMLVAGLIPCLIIFLSKVDYGKLKKFFRNVGIALLIGLGIGFGNMSNWPWIDKNSTVLGSLILPWSYIVNTCRYFNSERANNREEILLPDATISNDDKDVVVLVIGESARRDHFSLYGYERETNPLLAQEENLKVFLAESSATYTTAGVKAILDHQPVKKLYEILPNYLYRAGVDVIWRTSNWGQSPLHIEKYSKLEDGHYDIELIDGLAEAITESGKNKVLVVLHTSTSHGPSYNKRYPAEFEKFSPVPQTVEMSTCPQDQLFNAYDNSILFTDYILDSTINILKGLEGWNSTMIFVSDHGESLGEGNLYMHGVPYSIAPKEQIEIPYIVWTSNAGQEYKDIDMASQYSVFHSVLYKLNVESPVYDEEMNIFSSSSSQ